MYTEAMQGDYYRQSVDFGSLFCAASTIHRMLYKRELHALTIKITFAHVFRGDWLHTNG